MEAFTYARVKEHTGKVQQRTNGYAVASVANRKIRAGEVVAFKNADFTAGLVQTGNFIHVAAETPLGVNGDRGEDETAAPFAPEALSDKDAAILRETEAAAQEGKE